MNLTLRVCARRPRINLIVGVARAASYRVSLSGMISGCGTPGAAREMGSGTLSILGGSVSEVDVTDLELRMFAILQLHSRALDCVCARVVYLCGPPPPRAPPGEVLSAFGRRCNVPMLSLRLQHELTERSRLRVGGTQRITAAFIPQSRPAVRGSDSC